MSKSGYLWAPGEAPPTIGEHSLAKHEVLGEYLKIYVDVLARDPRMEYLRLTLVDGFAGGGRYRHPTHGGEHLGSPLIMLRAMHEAEYRAQERRTKKGFRLDARFFFVESDEAVHAYLDHTLKDPGFPNKFEDRTKLIRMRFEDAAPMILDEICKDGRVHRCIFLLDQYGWSDVTLGTVRKILRRLPEAEVLLTFATDKMINFLSEDADATLRRTGLSDIADALPTLLAAPSKRQAIQRALTRALIQHCGAAFYTPFFIRPSTAQNNDYWFIHLSNHARARDEMTKLHWSLQNHFSHFGRAGLSMLGFDPRKCADITGQLEIFDFGNSAEELTRNSLLHELPARIAADWPDGASFGSIFQKLCNETPATKQQIRGALRECVSLRELDLYDQAGRLRDFRVRHIDDTDVLRFSPQMRLLPLHGDRI